MEYLLTPYAFVVNGVMLLALIYCVRYQLNIELPLASGKYYVEGVITYSEYGMFTTRMDLRPEALVTCRYSVDGKIYNEKVRRWGYSEGAIARTNPKGKKVTVYYSPLKPRINAVDTLPRAIDIVAKKICWGLICYGFLVHAAYLAYKTFFL